ncbi:ABC transporter permease [Paenibacillus ginsengarvi]|uniref:ABC transporter permease n=1 Tax=Paenibacillus ginsengarvi TaxID=400777 RepID=A0A3B0BJZ0_9BACL|nr:ABC transporter permease [Paenibacillus ginsengarvi]RKN74153.1 ABC transporter permease [Paenibacillus ginsengarvi]
MKKPAYLLVLPGALFLTVFMVIPIALIILSTFQTDNGISLAGYINFFTDSYTLGILWTTLKLSLITTIICILLGFPSAYYISRTKVSRRGIYLALAIFPLLTSAVVRSFSWMVTLGKNGLINNLLIDLHLIDKPIQILYTETSIIIGLVHLFLPLMIISLIGVLENIDGDLVKAAASLGASRFKAFINVILPLSVPGLLVGSTLVLVGSLTAYATPQLLGGKKRVLATLLFQNTMTLGDWKTASIIATIMIALTFLLIGIINSFAKKLNPNG